MNLETDFQKYAKDKMGLTGMDFHNWEKLQESIYNPSVIYGGVKVIDNNSLTPYILEEREMRATQMDIFSRMMMDRVLWLSGEVNDRMSTVVQAQLMYLDDIGDEDIKIYVDSPGGSVKSGLSIVDTMNYINSDIQTVCTGMAASMGSILLGNGTKGKRFMLPNSRVMLHQVSSGARGTVADMEISLREAVKYNDELFELLGKFTNKTSQQVKKDASRDFWMNAKESEAYGIVDGIILKKNKK